MIYEYTCPTHGSFDVYKPASQRERPETCPECGQDATYRFVPTSNLNTGASAMRGEFYHAFGKHFNSRRELKNEMAKIEGETGKKIVEVGSEKPDSVKRKRKDYNVEEATRHLRHQLKHGNTN